MRLRRDVAPASGRVPDDSVWEVLRPILFWKGDTGAIEEFDEKKFSGITKRGSSP